ncbi:ATP-binding protein [Pedobacter sp. KBS0701]|uniref:ATP-binding protein n=1 Tax=Pedobacter sp. KBS0701 TaxID=2578106 RepID=UPI00110F22E1|nr:ATP-binding protein [Pedobacter sp. KBS0701]QDW24750.1 ATP-binding protein [Pedobacter sp. KBS0701]
MANFKARARALDLLGRQQIAGIPTAINELFKNAHDAYADNVDIDYLRKDKLLVLRDDGLGMTKKDFESRWLTLGTESKFTNRKIPAPPQDPDKKPRPIMGEKGIGRLAIASIGNQVLVLTKAKRTNEDHKIVAAFINWSIFELPGLDLDDVIVPIREFDSMPDSDDINEMKDELIISLKALVDKDDITEEESKIICDNIRSFVVSPKQLDQHILGDFSFDNNYFGTHFYISPVDETLNNDIDGDKSSSDATKIEKMLMGFTNTMTPGHPKPDISVAFRDYRSNDGTYFNILDKDEFFTEEDFEIADHHFQGRFDLYGQFSGMIKIYQDKSFDHKISWNNNNYRETDCGPFSINLAYIQGRLKQSIIDFESHTRIIAKGDKYGGLYIYRDNIRILPYGNQDYDFIDIEKNRTKSASFYFFSYRRMFGVIDVSKKENFKLKEKAGREGFIENKAYRQLQDILKNFFLQLAADFFREGNSGSPKSEFWVKKRSERENYYKALERRDLQAKVRKEKFQIALNDFFDNLNSKKYKNEIDEILMNSEKQISSVAYIEDPEEASQALIAYEISARKSIEDYKQRIKVSQPKGFTISKETRKDFDAYITEIQKLEFGILQQANNSIDSLIDDYTTRLNIEISKRKRLEQAVDYISIEAKKTASMKQKEAKEAVSEITSRVKDLTSDLMIDLDNQIRDVKDRFKTLNLKESEDFDLVEERKLMEADIGRGKDRVTNVLESIIRQLQGIYWDKNPENEIITNDQIADALAEEVDELRERLQTDIELSQLGLAVGVIHHEFSSTIKSIRGSIKDLGAWADVNDKLDSVYKNIKINFEHLDKYLKLFTPLNRRLNYEKEEIHAHEIKTFLIDLFGSRLNRHNVQFKHTNGFTNKIIVGHKSTFFPVFVNLIDNAIHWLNQIQGSEDKLIRLHADDSGIYISNNGPQIPLQDSDRIFELGFTRKLKGRGMGLHISREVLEADNYRLFLDSPRSGANVTFKIEPFNPA